MYHTRGQKYVYVRYKRTFHVVICFNFPIVIIQLRIQASFAWFWNHSTILPVASDPIHLILMENDDVFGIYARREYECHHGRPRFREGP